MNIYLQFLISGCLDILTAKLLRNGLASEEGWQRVTAAEIFLSRTLKTRLIHAESDSAEQQSPRDAYAECTTARPLPAGEIEDEQNSRSNETVGSTDDTHEDQSPPISSMESNNYKSVESNSREKDESNHSEQDESNHSEQDESNHSEQDESNSSERPESNSSERSELESLELTESNSSESRSSYVWPSTTEAPNHFIDDI